MQGRKAAAWSSLFSPAPQISVGSNSGSLWRVIGERAHWFAVGLGESHVWAQEAERESKRSGRHVCMCVCVFWGYAWKCSGPHEPLQNIHPFPLPALTVLSRPGTSQLFCVCVLFTVQASNGFIKLPKERKCCPCSDFPLKWSNRIAFYFV